MAELFTTEKAAAVMLLGCGQASMIPGYQAYVTGDAHHDLDVADPLSPAARWA